MAQYDNAGRIPRRAADASLLVLYVLAVVSAICRFLVRLHYQRRLFWDDAMLVLAILLISCCMGLWFHFVDDMYFASSLLLGQFTSDMDLTNVIPRTLRLHKLSDIALVLTWTSLNAIKFSFLLFFGTLTTRQSRLRLYWWSVVAWTGLTWAGGVPMEIVSCPYFDERALTCAAGHNFPKTVAIAGTLVALIITSDVLIISIPILILHRISIPLRTKIFLGLSLCLSVITISTTLVRVGGLKAKGVRSVDVVWQVYWQYVEVCIGIMIASATAFRTFFVQRAARSSAKRSTPRSYFGQRFRQKVLRRSDEGDEEFVLGGEIPGAKMTGMRTFIDGQGKTRAYDLSTGSDTLASSISFKSEDADKESVLFPGAVHPTR